MYSGVMSNNPIKIHKIISSKLENHRLVFKKTLQEIQFNTFGAELVLNATLNLKNFIQTTYSLK